MQTRWSQLQVRWRRVRAFFVRPRGSDQRGVALLMVMTAIVVLAAFSVEFSYNMRVGVYLAANLKREVQAYYHARSAMEIARATIIAEQRFRQMLGPLAANQNLELWRYACKFAEIFNSGKVSFLGKDLMDLSEIEGIGVKRGGFSCVIEPEDGKIQVARVRTLQEKSEVFRDLYAVARQYFGVEAMVGHDREAVELILNIIDWADADQNRSDIDEAGRVIEVAGGQEGGSGGYSRYGYEARNAKFDTNEELRLVEGMTDELFCDLAKEMTVYATEKLNINSANIEVLKALICEHIQGDITVACGVSGGGGLAFGYPTAVDYAGELIETCRRIKGQLMMPPFSSAQQFTTLLQKLPPPLNEVIRVNAAALQQRVGTRARIIRIKAVGEMGPIQKRLEAVMDTNGARLLYWREM